MGTLVNDQFLVRMEVLPAQGAGKRLSPEPSLAHRLWLDGGFGLWVDVSSLRGLIFLNFNLTKNSKTLVG